MSIDSERAEAPEGAPPPPAPPQKPARPTALQVLEALSKWLETLRSIAVSLVLVGAVVLAAVLVAREIRKEGEDGLNLDPIVVE